MDVDVDQWQSGIEIHADLEDAGQAAILFEGTVSFVPELLHILEGHIESSIYNDIKQEFRFWYLWNDGFSTRRGDLDRSLSYSSNLRATVLTIMAGWARAMCKGMCIHMLQNLCSFYQKIHF